MAESHVITKILRYIFIPMFRINQTKRDMIQILNERSIIIILMFYNQFLYFVK